jgi:hypothetical protein
MKYIEYRSLMSDHVYRIPNSWDTLTPDLYLFVINLLDRYSAGKISYVLLRMYYVCRASGWRLSRLKESDPDVMANIFMLSCKVSFIFETKYPDGVTDGLSPTELELAKANNLSALPEHLQRYLNRYTPTFVLKSCFCAQLVPTLRVSGMLYTGYRISTAFGGLTCSLRALQYIEASATAGKKEMLPLLAAILYFPGKYDSEKAQELAGSFKKNLLPSTLEGISFNFSCINNFIFTQTPFALLAQGKAKTASSIATGAIESLYNLSADGLGDNEEIEQMDIIKFLTILRKKTIESIQEMNEMEMKITDIAGKTGYPLEIISEIIKK